MIKKRNLDPTLIDWIMTETGLGPGIGEIRYVVGTSTAYRTQLGDMGVDTSNMYTTVLAAYNATTTDRNDIIFVMPGVYTETAAIAWSKSHVHMIGLAGPLIASDWTLADSCVIYTDTITVADVITLTGHGCIFKNLVIENYGANAANVSAVRVAGYGNYFEKVAFHGNMTGTQTAAAACASLYITKDGDHPYFKDCIIGQDVWSARAAANSGQLYFVDSGTGDRPNDGTFEHCTFLSTGTTNTAAMIAVASKNAAGRNWLFDNCHFYNFDEDATAMSQVFYHAQASLAQKGTFIFRNCTFSGYTELQDDDSDVTRSNGPATANAAGFMTEIES